MRRRIRRLRARAGIKIHKRTNASRRHVSQKSEREQEFLTHWIALAGPRLTAQYVFHPSRKWKFDWAHPASRVAIEVHGGTWMHKSRHVSGTGFWGDRIKMNAALRLDWKVFELISDDLSDPRIYREILDEIERRLGEGVPTGRNGLDPFGDVFPDRKRRNGQAPPAMGNRDREAARDDSARAA